MRVETDTYKAWERLIQTKEKQYKEVKNENVLRVNPVSSRICPYCTLGECCCVNQ